MDEFRFWASTLGFVCAPLSAIVIALVAALREITLHALDHSAKLDEVADRAADRLKVLAKEAANELEKKAKEIARETTTSPHAADVGEAAKKSDKGS